MYNYAEVIFTYTDEVNIMGTKKTTVFIDGGAGTTGLRIHERLATRDDIELLTISEEQRKDPSARLEMLIRSDVTFLCLPDDAAKEAVIAAGNADTVIIDTSTAHRTVESWTYGFPDLSGEFEAMVRESKRISVPGCHASGFIALIYPLVKSGILDTAASLSCFSVTGYSGGGKKMIAEYENPDRDTLLSTPRQYGLTQQHKHLREMKYITGLDSFPIFCPVVAAFYSGMHVTVPLHSSMLKSGCTVGDIKKIYKSAYGGPVVTYSDDPAQNGFIAAGTLSGKDSMIISVLGNDERIILSAVYDNLGKGASGTAIECLNLVSGNAIDKGLEL